MNERDRHILAMTLWMEARSEGADGIRAVAHVIDNRVKSGKWKYKGKSTHAFVCLGDRQFSAWNASRDDENREACAILSDDDRMLALCYRIVDSVADGSDPDNTGGALHYYNPRLTAPDWADETKVTARIGAHVFLKGVA